MTVVKSNNINLVKDIGQVLTSAGGNVDVTRPLTFFTKEAKINMWSKYKPVQLDAVTCQDFDDTKPDFIPGWWMGSNLKYGISIPNITLDMLGDNPPIYEMPQGDSTSPFRLGDFRNYNPDARAPYGKISGQLYYNSGSQAVTLYTPLADGYSVTLDMLFKLIKDDALYFGVQLISESGVKRLKTCDGPILDSTGIKYGNEFLDIDIVNNSTALSAFRSEQTITIVPFLSTVPQTTWASGFTQVGSLYQIAEKFNTDIKYYSPPIIYAFELTEGFMLNPSSATITVNVTNLSTTSRDFNWGNIKYTSANKSSYGKMNPTFISIDGNTTTDGYTVTINPGESTKARIKVTGSTSMVDYYSDVIEIFWYDPEFGYRTMGDTEITYGIDSGGGLIPKE